MEKDLSDLYKYRLSGAGTAKGTSITIVRAVVGGIESKFGEDTPSQSFYTHAYSRTLVVISLIECVDSARFRRGGNQGDLIASRGLISTAARQ